MKRLGRLGSVRFIHPSLPCPILSLPTSFCTLELSLTFYFAILIEFIMYHSPESFLADIPNKKVLEIETMLL